MNRIIEVKSFENKNIFVKYSDGLEGKISLEKLTTKEQYLELKNIDVFEELKIDENSGNIIVNGNIELCKNAIHEILNLKKQMARIGLSMDS